MGGWNKKGSWEDWLGGCRLEPVGSGLEMVARSCEYGDELSGCGATESVNLFQLSSSSVLVGSETYSSNHYHIGYIISIVWLGYSKHYNLVSFVYLII
jgi:hypothetical protein